MAKHKPKKKNKNKSQIAPKFAKFKDTEPYRAIASVVSPVKFFGSAPKMEHIMRSAYEAKMPVSKFIEYHAGELIEEVSPRGIASAISLVSAFGFFKEWCATQQTYRFSDQLIDEFRSADLDAFDFTQTHLPFPCIYINLNNYLKNPTQIAGLLVHTGKTGIESVFFNAGKITFGMIGENLREALKQKGDAKDREFTLVACAAVEYLILNPNLAKKHTSKKVSVGSLNDESEPSASTKISPTDWDVSARFVSEAKAELVPLGDLVPPSQRTEVPIYKTKGTHASPREHERKEHYRTYWTGPGRTIPVRKLIKQTTINKGKSKKAKLPEVIRLVN